MCKDNHTEALTSNLLINKKIKCGMTLESYESLVDNIPEIDCDKCPETATDLGLIYRQHV